MANLRDMRLRMRAIQQTLQVTRAMNLISTAKLKKGRHILEDTVPYFTRIEKSMFDIVSTAHMERNIYLTPSKQEGKTNTAVIVITSDKGLAGGYNANIFHLVNQLCSGMKRPVLIIIGAIGYRYFVHSPWIIMENFSFKSRLPEMEDAKGIADYVISQYLWGMFDEVHVVYTHMYSTIKLVPRERQILPLNKEKMQEEFAHAGGKRAELKFEYWPSKRTVFETLVPMYVKGIIYGALVQSYASEQSARMSAMDEASKNAEEMLADLRIRYNRVRQSGITQEITEIAGGAEALGK